EAMTTWDTTGIDWLPGQPGPVTLEGHQCLVFFLGGIPVNGVCTGFSSNPANPALPRTPVEQARGPYYALQPSPVAPTAQPCLADAPDEADGQRWPGIRRRLWPAVCLLLRQRLEQLQPGRLCLTGRAAVPAVGQRVRLSRHVPAHFRWRQCGVRPGRAVRSQD